MNTPSNFPGKNFLLHSKSAERLYFEYAAGLPIIDYHNHLPPSEVAGNRQFENLTAIWLAGDHYKWRAMRAAGVDERLITGAASDREKFDTWAATVPQTVRNPLYHWTHMELHDPLGIDDVLLDSRTAAHVWEQANRRLASPDSSVQGLLAHWKVEVICTTDDPTDDLRHHATHAAAGGACRMLPSFRPDRVFAVQDAAAWNEWVDQLAAAADTPVRDLASLLRALERRCDFFHRVGGRVADHGLECIPDAWCEAEEADRIVTRLRNSQPADPSAIPGLVAFLLERLGRMYHARGWTQQYHVGALRNVNARLLRRLGRDAGCDTIGDFPQARGMARLLDRLDRDDALPRTIVYNLNPADNEVLAAMTGCFQDGTIPGKIQFGSGWWFLDQKDGIEKQLDALSSLGLLSRFVGMLTDSRSFLSFSRHDYFRRILCNVLGRDIEDGLIPADYTWIGGIVQDICLHNARRYFNFAGATTTGDAQ